jgi:hypothetical protein
MGGNGALANEHKPTTIRVFYFLKQQPVFFIGSGFVV